MGAGVGDQPAAEAAREFVEHPAGDGEQVVGPGQRPRGGEEVAARRLDEAAGSTAMTGGKGIDRRQQFAAHRYRDFRRGRWRRRAPVGGLVDQRPVGLMADGRDQGDRRLRRRPDDHLFVEAPEVFEAAAAARHDHHVRAGDGTGRRKRVEAAYGRGDLGRGGFALDADRPDHDLDRKAVGEAVEDVADDGAGR